MLFGLWMAGRVARGVMRSLPRGQQPAAPPSPQGQHHGNIAGVILFAFLLPVFIAVMASAHSGHVSGKMMLWYLVAFIAGFWLLAFTVGRTMRNASYRQVSRKYRPKPDTTTQDWLALADELENGRTHRDEVIDQLLSVSCQDPPAGCLAKPGITCSGLGLPAATLSTPYPFVMVHLSRMNKAIRTGAVSAADVLAQYGGKAPPGVLL